MNWFVVSYACCAIACVISCIIKLIKEDPSWVIEAAACAFIAVAIQASFDKKP